MGSCYGHQLIALALCGPSHLRRCEHPEVGWIPIQIKKDNDLLGRRRKVFSFSSHFDEVINLGNDFEILASSKHCLIQAFHWKHGPVWGLQMHPEMNIQEGRTYIKNRIAQGGEHLPYYEYASRQKPRDSGLIRQIVKKFFSP